MGMKWKLKKNWMERNWLQVGLLNVDGYYNSLLAFMDKAVDEGFVTPAARHIILSAQTAQELMCKLEVRKHNNTRQFAKFFQFPLRLHLRLHLRPIVSVHVGQRGRPNFIQMI